MTSTNLRQGIEYDPTEWFGHDFPEHFKKEVPWFNEILFDDKTRTHKGIKYRVLRMPDGYWNGYVFLPKGHFLYGKLYYDEEIENLNVHGGITYSNFDYGEGSSWMLGFDTSHWYDHAPRDKCRSLDAFYIAVKNYKTYSYVVKETKKLIKDIKMKESAFNFCIRRKNEH